MKTQNQRAVDHVNSHESRKENIRILKKLTVGILLLCAVLYVAAKNHWLTW